MASALESLKLESDQQIACAICGHLEFALVDHILEAHSMSLQEYQDAYPDAPVVSEVLWEHYKAGLPRSRRAHPAQVEDLTISIRGASFPVNTHVPEGACLPLPSFYEVPSSGQLAKDIGHAEIALSMGDSMFIWGLPGSGKDAFFHAYSAWTRTPGMILTIRPGLDIEAWFFSRSFSNAGTFWEEGALLKALRDGYTAPDGTIHPYLVLISDFDRADRSQAEALRLILDSIQGRIVGPTGETHLVMPGTQIVVTSNTSGGGDVRGRMVSSNPIDASIMDRFQSAIQFHWMDWSDEEPILRNKFPDIVEKCPEVFTQVGRCVTAIRNEIHAENVHWEFSHRAVCAWMNHITGILRVRGKVDKNIVKRGARVILDKAPDPETREAVKKLMDPHIPGGALGD